VFVKRTVKHRGETAYEYLALVEAVRVEGKNTHRTLFRLGEVSELRESGQLDRIVKALATYAKGTYVEAGEIEGLGSPSFGAVAVAWSYFRRLGLDEHFTPWVMVVARGFFPTRSLRWWPPLDRGPVRGHVALCVLAATIEAAMAQDLVKAKVFRSEERRVGKE